MNQLSILILDDEMRLIDEIGEFLENQNFTVIRACKPSEAFLKLEQHHVDIALVDIKLPEYSGLEFIKKLRIKKPRIETIVMSGHGDMDTVIEAFRIGSFDYLKKPFTTTELHAALSRTTRYIAALEESREYASLCTELNKELAESGEFIGKTTGMRMLREQIALAAANPDAPVLIYGESGTGKELVARRIHALSARAAGRFVAVNCAAIPGEMFESEFFGHERGAFTDAKYAREGLFRTANRGTLFLDEVGELPLELQSKLLRVIEDRKVRPVGSDREYTCDVRIICATNRELASLVAQSSFRTDLYYRLAVMELRLPPLRARKDDIPELAIHFLKRTGLSQKEIALIATPELLEKLQAYSFPGNIRELRNFMERAAILRRPPNKEELAIWFNQNHKPHEYNQGAIELTDGIISLPELEKQAICKALTMTHGNLSKSAELLGITRQALSRRLEKYAIHLKNY